MLSLIFCSLFSEKKEFEPFYTGSFLPPSAENQAPGTSNIQSYVFIIDDFAHYGHSGRKKSESSSLVISTPTTFQFGLNKFLDLTFYATSIYHKKSDKSSFKYSNTAIQFGFQILREKKNTAIPNIRFTVRERFPTGKYQKLDPNKKGVDAAGTGAYSTMLGLNFSKRFYFIKYHPMRVRLCFNYLYPSLVHVEGFHSYGGGFNTNGKYRPPKIFQTFFAVEFSLTQKWVIASDFLYLTESAISFHGNPGITREGETAENNLLSSSQISLAPAIECNLSKNVGVIVGGWFSVYGRNIDAFKAFVFSFEVTF